MKKPVPHPNEGGSYIRAKDGSLKLAAKPAEPPKSEPVPANGKPADSKKGK